ncbi:unnamed protein product, partial [Protopolystoma xenopodis]
MDLSPANYFTKVSREISLNKREYCTITRDSIHSLEKAWSSLESRLTATLHCLTSAIAVWGELSIRQAALESWLVQCEAELARLSKGPSIEPVAPSTAASTSTKLPSAPDYEFPTESSTLRAQERWLAACRELNDNLKGRSEEVVKLTQELSEAVSPETVETCNKPDLLRRINDLETESK